MDFRIIAGGTTVVLAVVSYALYLKSIAKQHTKPHMYSWLLWSVLACIGFIGQVSDNAGPGAWNTGVTAIACFVIFLVAIKSGDRTLSNTDKLLLGLASVAVLVQISTSNHVAAVTLATFTALIGFFFTLKKVYKKPYEESWPTFFINANRNFISLFALSTISYLTFFYPLMMLLANLSVVTMILTRRHQSK